MQNYSKMKKIWDSISIDDKNEKENICEEQPFLRRFKVSAEP